MSSRRTGRIGAALVWGGVVALSGCLAFTQNRGLQGYSAVARSAYTATASRPEQGEPRVAALPTIPAARPPAAARPAPAAPAALQPGSAVRPPTPQPAAAAQPAALQPGSAAAQPSAGLRPGTDSTPPVSAPAVQRPAPVAAPAPTRPAAPPAPGVERPKPPLVAGVRPPASPEQPRPPRPQRVPSQFDVFIAIDVSDSTKRPSGIDVDADGQVGMSAGLSRVPLIGVFGDSSSDDPGDSVLACAVKAAKTLLDQLDSAKARVGLIAFSGTRQSGRATEPDARVVAPLTRNFSELRNRLDQLLVTGPRDQANLMAAVQLVSGEFERGFKGDPDRDVGRIGLLISDGKATLPALLSPKARAGAAVQAARDAARINARIYTYAIGRSDKESIGALQQIAQVTRGAFAELDQPSDLVARFESLDLAQIALTSGGS